MAKAVIVGASGLVGSHLLEFILQSPAYKEVTILVRQKININAAGLAQVVVDFEKLEDYADHINGHALFCCLGSTRKKTPDQSVYRKIDHDYPVKLAEMALKNNMEQYHLVSVLGANAKGSNFYRKMKGETENDVQKAGVKCLHIYQPSLLTGNRQEKRTEEKIAVVVFKFINPLLLGGLRKYRSIAAATVASAMYKQSLLHQEGVYIHHSDKIKEIA
jgi:uncharacterized protein YbjT (DUF2867 family)